MRGSHETAQDFGLADLGQTDEEAGAGAASAEINEENVEIVLQVKRETDYWDETEDDETTEEGPTKDINGNRVKRGPAAAPDKTIKLPIKKRKRKSSKGQRASKRQRLCSSGDSKEKFMVLDLTLPIICCHLCNRGFKTKVGLGYHYRGKHKTRLPEWLKKLTAF